MHSTPNAKASVVPIMGHVSPAVLINMAAREFEQAKIANPSTEAPYYGESDYRRSMGSRYFSVAVDIWQHLQGQR